MTSRPTILVSSALGAVEPVFTLRSAYMRAVWNAGGLPIVACPCEPFQDVAAALIEKCDGLLLTGGKDVDPRFFGEEPLAGLGEVFPLRDEFEIALARLALDRGLPVLGICRGLQVLNIAAGGTVHQDIDSLPRKPQILHRQTSARPHDWHSVKINEASTLSKIFAAQIEGDNLRVNSVHHQAANLVADGWIISATAADGIIEAIEHPGHAFALGVQWHPEELAAHSALFQSFIQACQESA